MSSSLGIALLIGAAALGGPPELQAAGRSRTQIPPHVVIVGGGFAGLQAAQALSGRPVQVTLIDQNNYHLFQPLLYQVATAVLSPADIAMPLREMLANSPNVRVLLGKAQGVDLEGRRLILSDGELAYDKLILASGARSAYFGHPEWEAHAPSLKGIDDALEIRQRLLSAFEAAERETDPQRRQTLLTFAVIGGGPTGVELAGSISELSRTLARHSRSLDTSQARIVLLEGGPRLLPFLSEPLGQTARDSLAKRGVEVRTNTMVTRIDKGLVETKDSSLPAGTILWASGVEASPLAKSLGVPLDRAGRAQVQRDLSIPGHPEAFVAGDLAAFIQDGAQIPGLVSPAIQMGRHAALNILRSLKSLPPLPFRFKDKGIIAMIGRYAAVGRIGQRPIRGLPAWLAWLAIHIVFLGSLRNRLRVLFEWAWAFLSSRRGAGLLSGDRR